MTWYQLYLGKQICHVAIPKDGGILYNNGESSIDLSFEVFFDDGHKTQEELIEGVRKWLLERLKCDIL